MSIGERVVGIILRSRYIRYKVEASNIIYLVARRAKLHVQNVSNYVSGARSKTRCI